MAKPLSSWTLLSLLLAAPLLGCVAKPPEKPIVLRPLQSERRLVRRAPPHAPAAAATTASAQAEAPASAAVTVEELPPPGQMPAERPARDRTLTAAEKAALFRDFDQYLSRPGRAP